MGFYAIWDLTDKYQYCSIYVCVCLYTLYHHHHHHHTVATIVTVISTTCQHQGCLLFHHSQYAIAPFDHICRPWIRNHLFTLW